MIARVATRDVGPFGALRHTIWRLSFTLPPPLPPPCAPDFNGDGLLNSDDFFAFSAAFFGGDAKFNGDGLTNSNDFF